MLEDESVFEGTACGDFKETVFETVFNTSMTGYFQIITDKANLSNGIVFTYPIIGNQGVDIKKEKSVKPAVRAIIVRELCDFPTNPEKQMSFEDYLIENGIPAIKNTDTRAIVRKIRNSGTMRGILTTEINDKTIEKIKSYNPDNLVEKASTKEIVKIDNNSDLNIGILDLGSSESIVQTLSSDSCNITLYPYDTDASVILNEKHSGIVISDGPGKPEDYEKIFKTIQALAESKLPIIGISMGHLATALSLATDIPFVIIRKRQYGLEGEKEISQKTGYGSSKLYINDLKEGEKILLIDDVVSTGGTLISTLSALKELNIDIKAAVAVIEKGEGKKLVEKETGIPIFSVVKLDVIDGKVVIEKTIED